MFVPPAPMIPISEAPAIDRGVIRSAANSRRRQSTPPRRPNPRHLAAVARATGGAETAPNFSIANDMSDSDATPMREGSLIALGSPITPPSAYRRADMLASSSAAGGISVLQSSTELVTTGGPPIVLSPSPNSLTAQMEFREQLAARAEHAMAVAEIEEARGVVQHARSTGEQNVLLSGQLLSIKYVANKLSTKQHNMQQ